MAVRGRVGIGVRAGGVKPGFDRGGWEELRNGGEKRGVRVCVRRGVWAGTRVL